MKLNSPELATPKPSAHIDAEPETAQKAEIWAASLTDGQLEALDRLYEAAVAQLLEGERPRPAQAARRDAA